MSTIRMPQLGESVVEGTIGKWLVREGQSIDKDQPVVEILTDKADSEINASEAGVVTKILAPEGATVAVGDALCEVDASAQASAPGPAKPAPRKSMPPPAQPVAAAAAAPASSAEAGPSSPAVRKLAREQGVDLAGVSGSGNGGRVTKDDVLRAVKLEPTPRDSSIPPAIKPAPVPAPAAARAPAAPVSAPTSAISPGAFKVPPYSPRPGDQEIPMSRRRRIIADHMVYSKLTSPHVMTMAEVDLHKTEALRKSSKDALKKEGVNLTLLAFVAAATAKALREHRNLNARVLSDSYVLLGEINLGIAVNTAEGLVVPVIRNAADLTVRGLARAIDEQALKARDGHLTPDDLAGKTFTISNPGRKGNLVGGAIINQPNVGILRTGEVKKRVVVVEHDDEDLMAIHPVMQMALSYDHRVVDGVNANEFLYRVRELLEAGEFTI
ncbi:MAG TPA: dihydrolipoamide acetyltransferase family protein [Polyangiales bacterium]|nr:dihydrolipoamide acetyltransferase family protein [Polyangiales bacterium]